MSLETSLRQGSVAALVGSAEGVEVLEELLLPAAERSARVLLPAVSELLDACGWQPSEIDLVCVTTGPGSFTGLRIGVTAAKTLAFAVGAKLVGVHTLAALAGSVPNRTGRVWAILDAQRQELFAAKFEGEQIPRMPETQILTVKDWLAELQPGDSVVGPPLAQLAERLPAGVNVVDAKLWQPQASVVGQLSYKLFQTGELVDPVQLVPNYYRKSAAEEKAAQSK
ncbi:MAG: tRNA (adenosine(37)-N6)-threonylcarbamoyltransferase complex dimerization subunit type 1 TsaB [Bythopirellula sp.]|nr:tRNA (adenosine(37)-N6)-threonylcarbamoyltransferase complex dimerization subunit type 1 TsaB [Bythopirellula sp.]